MLWAGLSPAKPYHRHAGERRKKAMSLPFHIATPTKPNNKRPWISQPRMHTAKALPELP
jgi:hypothetical protein